MAYLRTGRLLLRGWRDEDLEPFAALNADPEVMRHFPAPLSRAESEKWVTRGGTLIDERGWGLWAVEVTDAASPLAGRFIGFTGLSLKEFPAHFTPATEVGWRLAREAWGHGYASEAALASLRYAFDELALPEVVSMTAVGNIRSRAVMERIGMTRDPADDFDHPNVPKGHPLERHVLYRTSS